MGNTGVEPSNVSTFRDVSHRLNNYTLKYSYLYLCR